MNRQRIAIVGIALAAALGALGYYQSSRSGSTLQDGRDSKSGIRGPQRLAARSQAHVGGELFEISSPIQVVECSASELLDQLRSTEAKSSPALRSYLSEKLRLVIGVAGPDEAARLFAAENDPVALEAIGAAMTASEDPLLLAAFGARLDAETDPELRASMVRSIGEAAASGDDVLAQAGAQSSYSTLIRDPAPEVRSAIAKNLKSEIAASSGTDPASTSAALLVASAAEDSVSQAAILASVNLQGATAKDLDRVRALISSDSREVSAAAVRALGSGPPAQNNALTEELIELFAKSSNLAVRRAILEALARLKFADAVPILQSLKLQGDDVDRDIDNWIAALSRGWQYWQQIAREKQRLDTLSDV